jgi:predicted GTPase
VAEVEANCRRLNPRATIARCNSEIRVSDPAAIRGKRVLVIEDGPTLTHGEMKYGAGIVAARRFGAAEIVDPRPYVVGTIARTFETYPEIGPLLPAMGYGAEQIRDLQETIRRVPCDLVLSATPVDLTRVAHIEQPIQRVRYELQIIGQPTLEEVLLDRLGALSGSTQEA